MKAVVVREMRNGLGRREWEEVDVVGCVGWEAVSVEGHDGRSRVREVRMREARDVKVAMTVRTWYGLYTLIGLTFPS